MIIDCPYCEEYAGKNRTHSSRIIDERDGCLLIPTVGCFTEGYCLYLPARHVNSFATLATSELGSVYANLSEISSIIKEEYQSDLIIAEHGAGSASKCGASCINHAHLHLIPVHNSGAMCLIRNQNNKFFTEFP